MAQEYAFLLESLFGFFLLSFVLFFPSVKFRSLFIAAILSQFLPIPANIDALVKMLFLAVFYYANLRLNILGFLFALIGTLSNTLVIIANGIRMPATLKEVGIYQQYYQHTVQMSENTNLNFLGDWIHINGALASPGDVITIFGWLIIAAFVVLRTLKSISKTR